MKRLGNIENKVEGSSCKSTMLIVGAAIALAATGIFFMYKRRNRCDSKKDKDKEEQYLEYSESRDQKADRASNTSNRSEMWYLPP